MRVPECPNGVGRFVPRSRYEGLAMTAITREDVVRWFNGSNHDTARTGVSVDGMQYGDGHLERGISLYNKSTDDFTIAAEDARQLAAALIEAGPRAEQIEGTEPP